MMNKWSRKKLWLVSAGLAAFLLIAGGFVWTTLFPAHQHCSKALSSAFGFYAAEHQGQYPYHTNGFGDALLMLVKSGEFADVSLITAPGDNGRMYRDYLSKNLDVPEEECSRIYIQGLSGAPDDPVAMVFDKYPTRGGDHFRSPWGRPLRDVVMSDGSVKFVPEKRWPAFAAEQIEYLTGRGFKRDYLESLFGVKSKERMVEK